MKVDNQTKLMHAVWLKAFKEGEVTLKLKSRSDLHNIRFKLYNAAKVVRGWQVGTNMDLEDAVKNCSISVVDDTTLRVYRSDKSEALQDIAAQIGVEIDGMAERRQLDAEANAMLERMGLAQKRVTETTPEQKQVAATEFAAPMAKAFPYPLRNQGD